MKLSTASQKKISERNQNPSENEDTCHPHTLQKLYAEIFVIHKLNIRNYWRSKLEAMIQC